MTKVEISAEQYARLLKILKERDGIREADIIRMCNMSRGISWHWKKKGISGSPAIIIKALAGKDWEASL